MKKLIFLPILIFFFAFTDDETSKSRESRLSYQITESKTDPALKRTEAVFEIRFLGAMNSGDSKVANDSIHLSYNGTQKKVKTDAMGTTRISVKPGKYKFQFFYNSNYFEIATDSISIQPGFRTKMDFYFESSIYPVISDKPVIYVYPETTKQVEIKLNLKGELGFTYPKYENGWKFTADPNGTIHQNGKEYDYLFWDGKTNLNLSTISFNEGFLVKRDSLVSFFENKLAAMGLSPREMNDYITFWVPRMNANEINYIHFLFNEDYNEYASMTVHPKPDKLFRIYMIWGKADEGTVVNEQKIQSFHRSGFTILEWGGTEIQDMSKLPFYLSN